MTEDEANLTGNPGFEDNYIDLKWGTFKRYNLGNPAFEPLIDEYNNCGGMSGSAMLQKDTTRQKEIICEMIRMIGKDVYLDWDGVYVTVDEACKYVMEYNAKG